MTHPAAVAEVDSANAQSADAMPARSRSAEVGQSLLTCPWWLVVAAAAAGTVAVGWSYRLSAGGADPQTYYLVFWAGMLLATLPVVVKLCGPAGSRRTRLLALALLGVLTAVPKYLRNPTEPLYHDEYAHWRQAIDVLESGQLLQPNSLIPIVQFFPGTSGLTAIVHEISGLSVWHAGQLIVAVMHVATLFAVFVLVETHLRSARAGAIGALVYGINPSAMYFDTQYAYESITMALFCWVLALCSLAGNAGSWRARIGLTTAAVVCVAGIVVTHHLTLVFLIAALGIVSAGIAVHRLWRRRVDPSARFAGDGMAVWWTVFAATLALATLWVVFVATPTIDYLSPYFGGSVEQLGTMATSDGDGGRAILAPTAQPTWERILTAVAPVAIGLISLVGLVRIWRGKLAWPSATLAVIAFGLVYFPSVPFVLAPSGAEGARRSWGFTYVGLALLVALVWVGRPAMTRVRSGSGLRWASIQTWARRFAAPLSLLLVAVVLIGNVGGGLNDPYRFPGPFRWGTDTNSASDEARAVGRQLQAQAGDVRVVTDAYTALQIVAYGGLHVAAPSTGFPAWNLTQTGDDPPAELARMLVESKYDYLVVDVRMGEDMPFNGHNYGNGDPLAGAATPMSYLTRLDQVPWASRIMSTEHLRVYRLDLVRIGATLGGAR